MFFERVDQISLASESASPSVASVHRRRVFENGDKTQELMASAAAIDAVVAAERVDADEPADPHRPAPTTPGTKRMLTSEWLNAMPATFSPAMSDAGMSYAASPAAGVPASVPEEPEVEAAAEEEAAVFNLDEADEDAATVEVATTRAPSIAPSDERGRGRGGGGTGSRPCRAGTFRRPQHQEVQRRDHPRDAPRGGRAGGGRRGRGRG